MGCETNFKVLSAKTASDAIAEGYALIEQAAYEHGHGGYTGSWAECDGVLVADYVAKDVDDAEEWLANNAEKWGADDHRLFGR